MGFLHPRSRATVTVPAVMIQQLCTRECEERVRISEGKRGGPVATMRGFGFFSQRWRTTMNLSQYRAIANQMDREIEAVVNKYGFKFGKRGATVDEFAGTVSYRLTLIDQNLKDANGQPTTPEAISYRQTGPYIGLKAEWLNKPFKFNGKDAKITGLRSGRSSKPVLFEIAGKTYVTTVDAVRRAHGEKLWDGNLAEVDPPANLKRSA